MTSEKRGKERGEPNGPVKRSFYGTFKKRKKGGGMF